MSKQNVWNIRTLLEWGDELLSKMLDGQVMGECGYPIDCYDY